MVSKCERIPVSLVFGSGGFDRAEVTRRVLAHGHFSMAVDHDEYYHRILGMLMSDEDPVAYINENEPVFPGTHVTELVLTDDPARQGVHVLHYGPGMDEKELSGLLDAVLSHARQRHCSLISEYSGMQYYRRLFLRDSTKRRELAEAFFYTGDYEQAQLGFSGLGKASEEYRARMDGWCRLLRNEGGHCSGYAFDIVIAMDSAERMCRMIEEIPACWRMGAEYWLSKKELPAGRRMLSFYSCYQSFSLVGDSRRADWFRQRLSTELDSLISRLGGQRRSIWMELRDRVNGLGNMPGINLDNR